MLNHNEERDILSAIKSFPSANNMSNILIGGTSTLVVNSGQETYYYPPLAEDSVHDIAKLEGYGASALNLLLQQISEVRKNHEGIITLNISPNQVIVEM